MPESHSVSAEQFHVGEGGCLLGRSQAPQKLRVPPRKRTVWIVEAHLSLHDGNCCKGAVDRFFRDLLPVRTNRDFDDCAKKGSSPPQLTAARLHRWLVTV